MPGGAGASATAAARGRRCPAAHGVVGGYSDGTFRPGNNVTRGQTSKFIGHSFFPNCRITLQH